LLDIRGVSISYLKKKYVKKTPALGFAPRSLAFSNGLGVQRVAITLYGF
jgi:hypothetical protein